MNRIRRGPPGSCGGRRRCARLAYHLHRSRQPRPGAPTRQDANPMRDDPPVTDLVTRVRDNDQQARCALIERHAPLIWSICRRHQPNGTDEVGQRVWPRFMAGSPPPPGANAAGSREQRGNRKVPATCWTPRTSRTSKPGSPSMSQSSPSPTHWYMRRSPTRPKLPAANHHVHRTPSPALRPDQRPPEHPGREHRAQPPRLSGQAAPPSGKRRPDRHRTLQREE